MYEQETLPPIRAMKFVYRLHDQHRLNPYGTTNVILGKELDLFGNSSKCTFDIHFGYCCWNLNPSKSTLHQIIQVRLSFYSPKSFPCASLAWKMSRDSLNAIIWMATQFC